MNCLNGLLAIAYLGAIINAQDYCNLKSCNGAKHIACGNNNQIDPSCNATWTDLTYLKDDIVQRFNDWRNQVAGGKIANHTSASRMATMQWDYEFARLAGLNVKTCKFAHDACRNTANYSGSGQDLGQISWYGNTRDNKDLIFGIIDAWFDENKDSNMTYINKYSNPTNGKVIGHFTVMVADKNPAVGCAAIRTKKNDGTNVWDVFRAACNFGTTNWMGDPIYVSGVAASKCTTGRNPNFTNLCSVKEVYTGL